MSSNTLPNRRGLLRGLATLPLIGGGVTLISNPTGATEPVSRPLLDSYDCWLFYERRRLQAERYGEGSYWANMDAVPIDNGGMAFHSEQHFSDPSPSTRAAIVLSAVGCDWRRG